MPSPFPGMDPFIEARNRWPDFHHKFITHCADALNARLPESYVATVDERVQAIGLEDGSERVALPDVAVVREHGIPQGGELGVGTAVAPLIQPQTLPQSVEWLDEPTEGYIEVFHLPDYRLVTGIEVLSPSNKVNPGRVAYLAKRRDLLHQGVNLVEIDLLVSGDRLPMLRPLPVGDYYTFVTRKESFDQCDVYAWSVRRPLPSIPVPLARPDEDVWIDLAAVFRTTYDLGRYRRILRYDQPAPLSLAPADISWSLELARADSG